MCHIIAYRYCAGFQYDDPTIVGFSHTHLSGTGHSDLGDILLMSMVGDVKCLGEEYDIDSLWEEYMIAMGDR